MRSLERKQFLFDVFVTALEGGIGYWADRTRYHIWIDNSVPVKDLVEDLDGFSATIKDYETEEEHTINAATIARGINLIIDGKATIGGEPMTSTGVRARVKKASTENDAGDLDASDADVIVQAALFEDVVYG